MKHTTLLCSALILLASTAPARAQGNATAPATPSAINYQGVLSNPDGSPVSGVRSMRVKIYDAPTGGRIVYSEDIGNVTVQNGAYSFAFGNAGAGVAAALTGNDHLALEVNGAEGAPRTRLLAVPYALKSKESADAQYTFQTLVALGVLPIFEPKSVVATLAGSGNSGAANGSGTSASFEYPVGIALDRGGNVYISDSNNNQIRKIAPNGTVSTLAGRVGGHADGHGTSAQFLRPFGIAVDGSGNVFVADNLSHRIRKIAADGTVTTLAGSGVAAFADGQGTSASFSYPFGIAVDKDGIVYVTDSQRIRKLSPTGMVTTLAGSGNFGSADGNGTSASFDYLTGIAVDGVGNVYVADQGNERIRKVAPNGTVTTLAGSGGVGSADGNGNRASFANPTGIAVDGVGNVYVADTSNHRIRKISPNGIVTTLAGAGRSGRFDGDGRYASFNGPQGVAVDHNGCVYVADTSNNQIRKITVSD